MSVNNQPIKISKNFQLTPLALTSLAIRIFFKPRHSEFAIFHKNCYLDLVFQYKSYLTSTLFYEKHTFFQKNHSLFQKLPVATLEY